MKINEWKKESGFSLPLNIVSRIVGIKNANYFNELWNKDEAGRERVKNWIREAERKFKSICKE